MFLLIGEKLVTILFYLFRIFPIRKNRIVFVNYFGKGFGDNGKYIVNQLLKQEIKYDIVWLVRNTDDTVPNGIRKVKYNSIASVYEQVTARIWIDNCRKANYVRKRKGQFYILTWHGGIALKTVESDAAFTLPLRYLKAAHNDSKMVNMMLSNSKFTNELYYRAFWFNGYIAETGLPREDILFNYSKRDAIDVKKSLSINTDIRLLLYAPTFRNADVMSYIDNYSIDWDRVLESFEKHFGGKWIGAIRLHPNITSYYDKLDVPSHVINLSLYPDMQELLIAADALITDYSSTMFDFSIMHKPVFLFASDLDNYLKDRNFYFDLTSLPFPFSSDQDTLLNSIVQFDLDDYIKKLDSFYSQIGLFEGGNASAKVANIISKVIKNEDYKVY